MPLRDHFHPPLSDQRPWEACHSIWLNAMSEALNELLPKGYYALPEVHAGASIQVDVGTFGEKASEWKEPNHPEFESNGYPFGEASGEGSTALATLPEVYAPPDADYSAASAFADDFEIKVFKNSGGSKLVAAIELVSPAKKDRPETRQAFTTKCASYLHNSIAVIVVDIVTERLANLHDEIVPMFTSDPISPMGPGSPYSVAYRPIVRAGQSNIEWWPRSLAVGQVLPTLPLWLNAVLAVPVDLEATYSLALKRARIE